MVVVQRRPKKSETGKKYKKQRAVRLHETGRRPTMTKLGETKHKSIRVRGGHAKTFLLDVDTINVLDRKSMKSQKTTIKNVLENSANRNYVRRNILTKGTVVETELGKARITSRPGQAGSLSGELISK
jgi:small subunit ribosomal protein S8e